MKYDELIGLLENGADNDFSNPGIKKLLSPRPLERPEDLHNIISTRYRYTGPGKWVKILREKTGN